MKEKILKTLERKQKRRSEQLFCDCGNKLTDKELYFGQCLQCDKNVEEAN